ncbi:iduronate 2-sulfatase isoform X2 [Calliopsis andreniformis]|uniref:iduronate 2-sulfatase isoform X2 n=1 Tax=Calliopsis andreniformis TaxID=337506 RepID=UPI003FCCACE9
MIFVFYLITMIICCLARKQNFLLIIVDDLRPSLGCYGDEKAHTPHIDQLAEEAAIFSQAYAQQALCAPSRNSFLTSRRPDTLRLYDFYSYWRTDVGNFTTLPQHFKDNGYTTRSIGKVFHPGISSNNSDDSPYSWTEVPYHPFTERYKDAPVCQTNSRMPPSQNLVCPVKISSMPNKTLPDIEILKEAKRFLRQHAKNSNPFFLAVGFQKPHIPFKYPEKYLKYHPLHKFNVPEPYKWPENVSSVAYNPWIDLRKRNDVQALNLRFPWEKIPKSFARLIIQSYYAAVTYIDDLVGWSLGEHGIWAKYSNFDVALKVPLMISIPGLTFKTLEDIKFVHKLEATYRENLRKCLLSHVQIKNEELVRHGCLKNELQEMKKYTQDQRNVYDLEKRYLGESGQRRNDFSQKNNIFKPRRNQIIIDSMVELVDIFPTIADLANISIPICRQEQEKKSLQIEQNILHMEATCSEGITLLPLIKAVLNKESLSWKKAAIGQYPRPSIEPSMNPNSDEPRLEEIKAMGYTLRTERYRYTAWLAFTPERKEPDWANILAEELYDHEIDKIEYQNLANIQKYIKIKQELKTLLQRGWRNALPENLNF